MRGYVVVLISCLVVFSYASGTQANSVFTVHGENFIHSEGHKYVLGDRNVVYASLKAFDEAVNAVEDKDHWKVEELVFSGQVASAETGTKFLVISGFIGHGVNLFVRIRILYAIPNPPSDGPAPILHRSYYLNLHQLRVKPVEG